MTAAPPQLPVLSRGDVYRGAIPLPSRSRGTGWTSKLKWVVILQGGPDFAREQDVAYLVVSSYRRRPPQPWEVHVPAGVAGFTSDSFIDCRWPFTMLKADMASMTRMGHLPGSPYMDDISAALVLGLQL